MLLVHGAISLKFTPAFIYACHANGHMPVSIKIFGCFVGLYKEIQHVVISEEHNIDSYVVNM